MIEVRCEHVETILPAAADFQVAFNALPEWRRRKCEAFRFEADRRRSVAAWLLLRQMLKDRGLDADSLSVAENAFGKPAFDAALGIHFSLSHAGERVMAAVSDAEVGCDVERIVTIDGGMLNAGLTDAERMHLAALSSADRDHGFVCLWVRKESYVKAVGKGAEIGFSTFSALGTPPSPGWIWRDFDFADGYLGCVCTLKAGG